MRVLLCCVTALVLLGCETAVDPYVGTAEPYTIWGVINSAADTQFVRVFTVEGSPGIDRPGPIDAAVASTDLTTGERVEWRHRSVDYESGATGQMFWAPYRAQAGHQYRLDVRRSDGATSSAQVSIPTGVALEVDTREERSTIPVRIMGSVPHLIGVEVRYEATNLPPRLVWPSGRLLHPLVEFPVDVSYQDEMTPIPGGWEFHIQMQRDYGIIRGEYERNCLVTEGAPGIVLRRVELRMIAADSAWVPPGGVFDPEVLVQPDAMTNVENGFGFLGAGQVVRLRWTPPRAVRDRLGFSQDPPCNNEAAPVPACMDPPIPCLGENAESVWELYF